MRDETLRIRKLWLGKLLLRTPPRLQQVGALDQK